MVNPTASSMSHLPYAPMAADSERPPAAPHEAVIVAPRVDTHGTRGATTHTGAGPTDRIIDSDNPMEKALSLVNNSMKAWSTGMRFDMDEEAQRMVVSIIDSETGNVLRTVPSDAVIRVAKMIVQLQGANIDTKA